MLPNPQPYFAKLVDPRRETRNKRHALHATSDDDGDLSWEWIHSELRSTCQ
ncbi:hypothetical protein SAMN04244572_01458 [Azotobacter beijerinckii]|uniref:Uncharacterized protein n=1 Tax=Azotobacter beijerinckii TaxID=170623 RepID=A0A1H9IL08_9GAMM|nr:hypothetical protein [Azotobacter beijerinckii]SEI72366.1 hypothetical protein SAMN04244572_01458 [Azotobacter beijerinckii]SEQ75227.1 hypothetical protein SAMN04244573_02193 [Azotobacter beijerinckii]